MVCKLHITNLLVVNHAVNYCLSRSDLQGLLLGMRYIANFLEDKIYKELHLWEEMELNEDLLYLMDEKKMRKSRKGNDKRMGS